MELNWYLKWDEHRKQPTLLLLQGSNCSALSPEDKADTGMANAKLQNSHLLSQKAFQLIEMQGSFKHAIWRILSGQRATLYCDMFIDIAKQKGGLPSNVWTCWGFPGGTAGRVAARTHQTNPIQTHCSGDLLHITTVFLRPAASKTYPCSTMGPEKNVTTSQYWTVTNTLQGAETWTKAN